MRYHPPVGKDAVAGAYIVPDAMPPTRLALAVERLERATELANGPQSLADLVRAASAATEAARTLEAEALRQIAAADVRKRLECEAELAGVRLDAGLAVAVGRLFDALRQ